jgi:hypothetical protein
VSTINEMSMVRTTRVWHVARSPGHQVFAFLWLVDTRMLVLLCSWWAVPQYEHFVLVAGSDRHLRFFSTPSLPTTYNAQLTGLASHFARFGPFCSHIHAAFLHCVVSRVFCNCMRNGERYRASSRWTLTKEGKGMIVNLW